MTEQAEAPKRVYLIDGSGYIFRAYYGLPPMNRADGTPTNAVFGFCTMLLNLVESTKADYLGVIFDKARKTFRNDIYKDYKAHRPPAPDDLIPQFPLIRQATKAMNIQAVDKEGFEADDLLATYATQACKAGFDVTIVSSDKDLMQLVRPGIKLWDPMKNRHINEAEVVEKFGVVPSKVIDVQALAGDSADNVPGVYGIGPKIAAELIQEYGSLEALLDNAEKVRQPKRRANLIAQSDKARISKELVTLVQDVPLDTPLEAFVQKTLDRDKFIDFLEEMGFSRLLARLNKDAPQVEKQKIDYEGYTLIQDVETLKDWLKEIKHQGVVAVDTETTSLDSVTASLVGVSLCVSPNKACYIPIGHSPLEPQGELLVIQNEGPIKQIPKAEVLKLLKPILEDAAILKVGQNLKYDMNILENVGIKLAPIDDTMLISFVLNAGRHGHGMDELSKLYLHHTPIPFKEVVGTGRKKVTFDKVPLEKACPYAAEDADITLRLYQKLKPQLLENKMVTVYETLERPLVPILAKMERVGIKVNTQALKHLSHELSVRLHDIEENVHTLAGGSFNIASPKQLGEVLFDKLGLSGGKKTKTGAYSTNVSVLEALTNDHPIIAPLLEWRQLSKLKSTYTDSLSQKINPKTGRIHTSFAMTGAQTGRLSSSDPNLQNIPVRTKEGRLIRQAFIASPGCKILSLDYSQIELRILSQMANIKSLKQAFDEGVDIHKLTASQVFGIPTKDIDVATRRKAKAINFGIIYGISAFGLSIQLGVSRKQAQALIEQYFKQFPGIRDYMDDIVKRCRKQGFVETLFGRRIYLTGINDKNPMRRNYAQRQAINAPIQGTAADIIKRAMIKIPKVLKEHNLEAAKMMLQVHDELIFDVPDNLVEKVIPVLKATMEQASQPVVRLDVPLVVDCGVGDNWDEAH